MMKKAKAKECMDSFITALTSENFSYPVYITDSGNGYNAYLMIDFPNDKEHNKLIADFIKIVHDKYSNDFVDVDLSTKNPARIAKVAGSWSAKGDNTAERPHRQCGLLEEHTDVTPVTAEQLAQFINDNKPKKLNSKKKEKPKKIKIHDVKGWLDSHEIEYQEKETELDGSHCTIYILKDCPFEKHDNQNCSFLAQFDDMSVIFKCHHTHCTQNIYDFIAVYPLPKQIPLLSGDDKKVELYNNIVLTAKLMNDNNKKPYIMLDNKVIPFESEECKKAFSKIALSKSILLSSNAMNTVHASISALFDDYADTAPIGTRIIHKGNDYYYAVAPDKVIHICNGTAEIVSECPVYFAYDPQFVPQITPDLTSPATALPKLVDELFSISPQNKLRFLAQLCGFFMPNLPTPILVLSGGHGTAKTTTARKLISLVDPKLIDVISIPDKEDGLTAILSGNYIAVLDNVDTISPKFSDILCIACTGGYTAKRKLYTDNAIVSAPLKTHIILNGIGDFISRPDLAERSNIIYLDPITTRMTEKQVWKKFNKLKPQLLGSIFNTIANGLTLVDDMENKVTNLPRMADFAQYGAAFIKAMGLEPDEFIKEYSKSNTQFIADCSSSDPFIVAVNDFVESNGSTWTGTATQLLEQLKVNHSAIVNYTPSTLSRKLNQCSTDLKATGISVDIKATTPKSITLSHDDNTIVF